MKSSLEIEEQSDAPNVLQVTLLNDAGEKVLESSIPYDQIVELEHGIQLRHDDEVIAEVYEDREKSKMDIKNLKGPGETTLRLDEILERIALR